MIFCTQKMVKNVIFCTQKYSYIVNPPSRSGRNVGRKKAISFYEAPEKNKLEEIFIPL
jgi:hypothetical protein